MLEQQIVLYENKLETIFLNCFNLDHSKANIFFCIK